MKEPIKTKKKSLLLNVNEDLYDKFLKLCNDEMTTVTGGLTRLVLKSIKENKVW
jgi:hypothetical protein